MADFAQVDAAFVSSWLIVILVSLFAFLLHRLIVVVVFGCSDWLALDGGQTRFLVVLLFFSFLCSGCQCLAIGEQHFCCNLHQIRLIVAFVFLLFFFWCKHIATGNSSG